MEHSDIEHMAQGYPPSHIGKDCEEVITWLATQLLATQEQRDAMAALAAERRQFIVNGVEMGDILLPVIDGDPAIGIHERCLLKPKFAYDAYLNSVRAEGIHFAANRMLAAWESGFIDDTPAHVHDISGAVLSALEFLPSASPEEFKRDYADEVRSAIANQLRAGKDGE